MFQKTIVLALLTIFIVHPFYGQDITWGEKILNDKDERIIFYDDEFIKKDSEGIHMYSFRNNTKTKLFILDSDLNLVSSKETKLPVYDYPSFGEKMYKINYTAKRGTYLGSGITSIGLSFYDKDYEELQKFDFFEPNYKEKWMPRVDELSPDKSKLLLGYDNEKNIKSYIQPTKSLNKAPLTSAFVTMDTDGKLLLKKEIKSEAENKLQDMLHFRIDNDGNVFALTETYKDKRKKAYKKGGKANSYYTLTKYMPKSEENIDLTLDGNMLMDANMIINKRNNISIVGTFSNEYALIPTGYYHIEVDGNTLEVINKELKPFSEGVAKNLKELGSWKLGASAWVADMKLNDDGSIFVFVPKLQTAYQNDGVSVSSSGNAKAETKMIEIVSNYIVFQVDKNGKLDWNKEVFSTIPEGRGSSSQRGSFCLMKYNGKHLIIWSTEKAYLMTTVDNQGNIKTKHFYSGKKDKYEKEYGSLSIRNSFFISEDELLVKGIGKGISFYRFGKVNLSELFE